MLSGGVPVLVGNVEELIISDNDLSGDISDSFNCLPELVALEAARNDFAPFFPSFNQTTKIEKIDLGGNGLTDWAANADFTLYVHTRTLTRARRNASANRRSSSAFSCVCIWAYIDRDVFLH